MRSIYWESTNLLHIFVGIVIVAIAVGFIVYGTLQALRHINKDRD